MTTEVNIGLAWARHIDIATAFLTSPALERIGRALGRAKREKRKIEIRLLVGLYQRFTTAQTLKEARGLQRRFGDQFKIRIARNNRFHWKLYIFSTGVNRRLYVGSANFTEDGLRAEGELSLKVTATDSDAISKTLQSEFDAIWQDDKCSFSPSTEFVKEYGSLERPPHPVRNPEDTILQKHLTKAGRVRDGDEGGTTGKPGNKKGASAGDKSSRKPDELIPTRIVFVNWELSEKTQSLVAQDQTSWARKDWQYTVFNKGDYENTQKARLVLYVTHDGSRPGGVLRSDYWIELHQVQDHAEIKTEEGKYFIAHSKIPNTRRISYEDARSLLIQVRLGFDNLYSSRLLNRSQLGAICEIVHISPERLRSAIK